MSIRITSRFSFSGFRCEVPENVQKNWFEYGVQHTQDVCGGPCVNWMMLYENFQIEHHLFPGVAHIHYPAISKIVKRVCAKHDIPYGEFEHFRTLYKSHLSTLYKLGHYKNLAAADSAEGKKQK